MPDLELAPLIAPILATYHPDWPAETAQQLRALWVRYEPRSMAGIKASQREQQETLGTPVDVLRELGLLLAKASARRPHDFVPLARTLWDSFGREGRVVGLVLLGKLELAIPETIVPLLRTLCRTCLTWEDADRLAMDALEQVVRKDPDTWLDTVTPWLSDENMWVRRAGVTVVGRLPMKKPAYTARCLAHIATLLEDPEVEVKKAVSFAIRVSARGDVNLVRDFLAARVPPAGSASTWVLCDAIRSMTARLLPALVPLLAHYDRWLASPDLDPKDRRSVESAAGLLREVALNEASRHTAG